MFKQFNYANPRYNNSKLQERRKRRKNAFISVFSNVYVCINMILQLQPFNGVIVQYIDRENNKVDEI